jgi:hypothetical protein
LSNTHLILSSAEDATGGGLLFEHLLLMRIRVADLDQVFFATGLRDGSVVEVLDYLLADIARLESGTSQTSVVDVE